MALGSCEDYAAALTVLLQEMGLEAVYVAGLTISVEGDFVDHAWTAVQLRGEWYHLDAQLEDNILRNDFLTYRYFKEYLLSLFPQPILGTAHFAVFLKKYRSILLVFLSLPMKSVVAAPCFR